MVGGAWLREGTAGSETNQDKGGSEEDDKPCP
jgi:hypothetical protein